MSFSKMQVFLKMLLLMCWLLELTLALTPRLEAGNSNSLNNKEVTVKLSATIPTLQDSDGDTCQCVPYYLCDTNLNAVKLNDPTITGFGLLEERFGASGLCQESVELCCKIPKINRNVTLPKPDSSRLKGCGYRNPRGLDFNITANNNEAQFGEFPWVVALLDPTSDTYYGVGVLIHPQVVMTVAHIVHTPARKNIKIRAGEWDTRTSKERLQAQDRLVDLITIREGFIPNPVHVANDIALLRLKEPVQLADHINVLCLPSQDESFDDYKSCIANGWGKDLFGRTDQYSVILKKVELDMVDNPTCNQVLQTWQGPRYRLHSSIMCAGGREGVDTCKGDGGAPLACPVGNDRYKLSGLVVAGIGCGEIGLPGLYTRVSSFRRWVDQTLDQWGFSTTGYDLDSKQITFRVQYEQRSG